MNDSPEVVGYGNFIIVDEEPEPVGVIVSPGGRTMVEEDAPGERLDVEAVGIGTDLG